ncbi:hypothetical protein PVK06_044325 [Gossypium arboreum]|uniref:Reverse transcriptase zinc-binding domain-containing protein n=1 Tax=Gossypium arboreum TaxID=29729 RepID=A0ABR0MR62_GOSAR|nr:hypothetical protein PVK06_044325 [Gossypium arboreum]
MVLGCVFGVNIDVSCPRCGGLDSLYHFLLWCPFAQAVWQQAGCSSPPSGVQQFLVSLIHSLDSIAAKAAVVGRQVVPTG